jgi:hypothetical protein
MRALATLFAITLFALSAATTIAVPQIEPLLAQCRTSDSGPASPLGASREFLAPHRIRMHAICNDWQRLASASGDRAETAARLLERCLAEAAGAPVRFHDAAFQAYVRDSRTTCRRLYAATAGYSS